MNVKRKYFVFDVESVGLHGEGFAVGWVIVDEEGKEHRNGLIHCPSYNAHGSTDDHTWVMKNVPDLGYTDLEYPFQVRQAFWKAWVMARYDYGNFLTMVADCPWPVEARFLNQCVDDVPGREWKGPYPLLDVGTALKMVGRDPLGTSERLESELPQHNPLADARQSARLFTEALTASKEG